MNEIEVILGNSNRRFSGVTQTMLQVLGYQKERMKIVVLGGHHLPDEIGRVTFFEALKLCRKPLSVGRKRVFHARRNDEMIQALMLRWLAGGELRIVFTSTAQREHSWLTKYLISRMDGLLSTCSGAARVLKRKPDRIIPHGVDLEEFSPPDDREALWKELGHEGSYGVGIFGRVRPQKGTDLFVRAAISYLKKDLKPTFVIVGEVTPKFRPFQKELEDEIAKAGFQNQIVFLGKRSTDEVRKYFQACSLVAALSRNEGFGLTILEAMASGCAVLATETGAWRDIVRENVDGKVVPIDDQLAVTEAFDELLEDSDRLSEMGKNGRSRVTSDYSIANEGEALLDYYVEMLR